MDIGGYVEHNQIQWSFECSETDVGIELWLLTLGEYINYTNKQPPYGWFIISDGTKHQDSGIRDTSFLNVSIIFLIFTNRGLIPATLTFTVNFASIYQEPIINPPFFNLNAFLIIIFAIITVSIVIYFFKTHKRVKKPSKRGIIEEKLIYPKPYNVKKEIESSQHIISFSTYCSFCGNKIVNDVKICSQCGSRIKK